MTASSPQNTATEPSAQANNAFAKQMLTAVNFFVETNRLEPYTAVYLIQIMGWNEVSFGIVSLAMNMAMLIFQTPAGDLLDKTKKKKKIITTLAILIAALTTVMVVWTSNFWAILVGKTIEGISATIFLPALMALLLGICQNEAEVPSFIATTEVSNKIGSFLIVCACAAITYYAFPNVDAMFYLLGAGGLAAAVFTLLIPESSIDHNRARQLGENQDDGDNTSEDESEDKDVEDQSSNSEEISPSDKKKTATPSRYLEILKNPKIVLFAIITFSYHLANAGVVPLLAQYVAVISSDRSSLTWTSAILIIFFFAQAITSYIMSSVVDKFNHKSIMIVAFLVLPIRCACIALMIVYWKNPWGLVATQVFDGIGAGVYDIMLPIIVKKLTSGSGRFGFTFGFIVTCWRIGHGFSLLVGEAVVHSFGYTAAFVVLGSLGVLNLLGFITFFTFDNSASEETAGLEEKKDKSEADETEELGMSQSSFAAPPPVKMSFTSRRSLILANIADLREQIKDVHSSRDSTKEEFVGELVQVKELEQALAAEVQKLQTLNGQEQEVMWSSSTKKSTLEGMTIAEEP